MPTEVPRFDTVWEITLASDSVRTDEFLPEEMRPDPRGFAIDSFTFERSVRLDQVCELCTCFDGPIPELELVDTDWRLQLPSGLVSAEILEGRARLVLRNRLGFDLLDNGAGNRGVLRVELVDIGFNGGVRAVQEVRDPFPSDSELEIEFDLAGIELSSNLVARIGGTTPGSSCTDLSLDPSDGLDAFIGIEEVVTAGARVVLSDADVQIDPERVELPGFIADRLRPGEAELLAGVRIRSSLPAAVELNLSVASDPEALQTSEAALRTPIELSPGSADEPTLFDREYLIDLETVEGADELHFGSENRIAGNRVVTLFGTEQVRWEIVVQATVPTR